MKTYLTETNIILLAVILGLLWFIGAVSAILLPFVLAFVLAYILHPVAEKLSAKHLNRGLSAGLVVICFCLLVVAVFLILVPILQAQVIDFIRHIPVFSANVWNHLKDVLLSLKDHLPPAQVTELSDAVRNAVMNVLTAIGASLSHILSSGVAIFNIVALILITPVVLFYVLRDWTTIRKQVGDLMPKAKEKQILSVWEEIDQTLSGFIRGQTLVCLTLGLYYGIGLYAIGLDYGILLGLMTGILSFVPYFGFGSGLILSIFLGLMQGLTWGQWGGLAGVFLIGQILEGYILTPRLVGKRVGLHPVWIIFALLAGGALFSFVGVLIAVPTAAVIGVLVRRFIKWYQQTDLYRGKNRS